LREQGGERSETGEGCADGKVEGVFVSSLARRTLIRLASARHLLPKEREKGFADPITLKSLFCVEALADKDYIPAGTSD